MPTRNLDRIFAPRSIAVIGASLRKSSVGQTVLKNLVEGGFQGQVYPVNPKYKSVDGKPCVGAVADIPGQVDLAVICTPAATVAGLVRQCGDAGIRGLVILSAGFREAGEEGKRLESEVALAARQYGGMRIIGPNCLGIMSPHHRLNASFASDAAPRGNVAFLSQSGALCTSMLDWAIRENIGFSHFVSVGNMMDVGIADLIDYFASDPATDSIILYVESITGARQFMSAARAFTRHKPIIAYKAGRFAESAKAAASHTGAMAGVDSVYEAALARAGIVRVFEVEDLYDCAELLARQKTPSGPRLAIVTNAGGPGVMATDALLQRDGSLAELSDVTIAKLDKLLPAAWSRGNPVDILGDAPPKRFATTVQTVLRDQGVDGVIVVLSPQAMTDPTGAAKAVIDAAKGARKPILTVWMGGSRVRPGIDLFNQAGIPTYATPEKAVRAFMYLVAYARNRDLLYETPREVPMEFQLSRRKLRSVFDTILTEGHDILSESTSKAFLEAYEIPIAKPYVARSKEDAVEFANRVGFPVALKAFSPDITHKTDVGGVELDLATEDEVLQSYQRILDRATKLRPDARVEGVTVQHMISDPCGRELIVGVKRDPVFGAVLLVGAGGTSAELFQDRALELPPLSESLARRMLESLKSWPLLQGYRGKPGVNLPRLIEVLMRLSYLVADYPEISEMDVNPLLATPEDAIALDARIVIDRDAVLHPVRPYSHLAIRPYPDELIKRAKLKDGTPVLLRPIKPEDEPMWRDMLATCSEETIRLRFRYLFRGTTHEMASRFCFNDYDREIAIVAEIEEMDQCVIAGVGRLVADVDHDEAEYAVLVGDPWHGIGLGSMLTDYCLGICDKWNIQKVVAEVAPENKRMLDMFTHRKFELDHRLGDDVVIAHKVLSAEVSTAH
ncbi:bifunctional acetate--CoA ligase family protein/GNAT family N-acetyltransferase [Planctomycetes bacterium K23_9]|uniref:Succinyl-CoA ligase [ADP-forming] subunit alpha n=1 Tax=Stieleria marina TaxID=1930275 RepID=A0A517NZZ8_9BACT|nr:Succinyl-CoA ligase [ADP-forming] subunit alpha [Planctomycetes bacterium K23_9]